MAAVMGSRQGRRGALALAGGMALTAACSSSDAPTTSVGSGGSSADVTLASSGSVEPCAPESACASTTEQATVVPLAVYILFDKSASMLDDGKWEAATEALTQFFSSKQAAGLRIAFQFFPASTPCQSSFYENPEVALATLSEAAAPDDAHEQALVDAVDGASPSGTSTPIYAALKGAYAWGEAQIAADENQQVAVVLVTDGEPDACPQDTVDNVASLAAEAAKDGTFTYVIGLQGSSEADLHTFADAGGTNQAFVVGSSSLTSELADALGEIRVSKLACQFDVPQTPDLVPTLVNVCFTPGAGGESTLEQVDGVGACGSGQQWYYDNPTDPQQIVLCPSTCASAQADSAGQIEIVFGCPTVIPR